MSILNLVFFHLRTIFALPLYRTSPYLYPISHDRRRSVFPACRSRREDVGPPPQPRGPGRSAAAPPPPRRWPQPLHRPPAGGTSGLAGRGRERGRQGTQGSTKAIAICNCEPPSHCSPFSFLSQRQVTGKDRASIEAIPHLHTSSVPFWHSKTIIEAKYPGPLD